MISFEAATPHWQLRSSSGRQCCCTCEHGGHLRQWFGLWPRRLSPHWQREMFFAKRAGIPAPTATSSSYGHLVLMLERSGAKVQASRGATCETFFLSHRGHTSWLHWPSSMLWSAKPRCGLCCSGSFCHKVAADCQVPKERGFHSGRLPLLRPGCRRQKG